MSNIQITEMNQGNILLSGFITNLKLQNGFHLLTRLMNYEKIL